MVSGRFQVGKLISRQRTVRLDMVKYRLSTLPSTVFATVARSSLMPATQINGCNTDKQAVMLGKRTLLLCQLWDEQLTCQGQTCSEAADLSLTRAGRGNGTFF